MILRFKEHSPRQRTQDSSRCTFLPKKLSTKDCRHVETSQRLLRRLSLPTHVKIRIVEAALPKVNVQPTAYL